jgi:hypothetical protein
MVVHNRKVAKIFHPYFMGLKIPAEIGDGKPA